MVAAAGSQGSPFRSVWVRLERGVASPLGKRKQIVALTLSEQGQREQRGDRAPAHPPGTAPRVQRVPLCPGLCWLLFQESDSPPSSSLQAKSEACSPVGAQGEAHQTRDSQLLS